MPKIHVHTPFTLQHGDEKREFAVGSQTVSQEIAEHWYVKAHTGPEPEAVMDTEAAADALLDELDAKAKALQARSDELDAREKELAAREQAISEREDAADQRDVSLLAREKAVTEREQVADKAAESAAKGGLAPK